MVEHYKSVDMARQYNNIYTKLVEGEDDIVGHVAYSLYKADKVQYIEKFKDDYGREPTEEELRPFHDSSCLSGAIKRYQASAVELLKSFLDETLLETVQQTEQQQKTEYQAKLESITPLSSWKRYGEGILQSIIGAFLFAGIIAIITFIIQFKGTDFRLSVKSDVQTTEVELIPTQQQANN